MALEKELDRVDWQLVALLQENGRLSFAELGRRVGLSLPAAAERVRRLEEVGLISGYHAHIDRTRAGLPVLVFVSVRVPPQQYPAFKQAIGQMAAVLEAYHVTGEESFLLKLALPDIAQLEGVLARLSRFGQTSSRVVLSTTVERQPVPVTQGPS